MNDRIFNATLGAMLHDIGKVVFRSSLDTRQHSISGVEFVKSYTDNKDILNSIRYHHKQELESADISKDSPAFVVYIADNISSGIDRREQEGEQSSTRPFDKNTPLYSVFNLLNNNTKKLAYRHEFLDAVKDINYPQERLESIDSQGFYKDACSRLQDALASVEFKPDYINSFMEMCEAYLSYVPSSTSLGEVPDISLYDHQKTTAAIAACIASYLDDRGISDFKEHILRREKEFYEEKAFLMTSFDISGIQQFIYTISSKGALRSLRARSFYLEIMLEHIVDELLEECGLSRANLIYTGGGHAYLLLPNTTKSSEAVELVKKRVNSWFMKRFGTALYIAAASQECSAIELMNKAADQEAYQNIFRRLSSKLSKEKMRRYGADEIMGLNSKQASGEGGRECTVCGAVDNLKTDRDGLDICSTCGFLKEISSMIIKRDMLMVSTAEKLGKTAFEMPSVNSETHYIYAMPEKEVKELLKAGGLDIKRIYGKNKMYTGVNLATKLWMGDYAAKGAEGVATLEELAQEAKGIERIAVLRADVDNLGKAFVSGFTREGEAEKYKYVTLSRTTTLSRQLSLFFKHHINGIMEGNLGEGVERFSLDGESKTGKRRATIVYSGGDDMFVVGAWNDVIELAVDIKRAFERFCSETLSISAGIPLFGRSYPMSRMAYEAGDLEESAKGMPGKNSVSLFGMEVQEDGLEAMHTYSWKVFEENVVGEKLRLLQKSMKSLEPSENGDARGKTFVYNLMNLIREAEKDSINIARCAYMLSRLAPSKDSPKKAKESYAEFSKKMYQWILDREDRKQLLTAINLYIYLNREKSGNHDKEE